MNLNDVKIAGNLVKDPELQHTPQGTPVTNVSLGVNETYTLNDEKRTATTFVDVQLWGAAAENFAKLVQKGQQILVEGALRQDTWEDKQTKQNSLEALRQSRALAVYPVQISLGPAGSRQGSGTRTGTMRFAILLVATGLSSCTSTKLPNTQTAAEQFSVLGAGEKAVARNFL